MTIELQPELSERIRRVIAVTVGKNKEAVTDGDIKFAAIVYLDFQFRMIESERHRAVVGATKP